MMQTLSFCIASDMLASSYRKAHHNGIMPVAAASAKRSLLSTSASGKSAAKKPMARRTTVTLSPQAQEIVERFRSASGTSTSAAIDRIIQRSEPKPSRLKVSDIGLLVLDVPAREGLHFTLEDIKKAEDEMDREYVERLMRQRRQPAPKGNGAGRRK
jgi:hypothetical protein